MLPPSLTEIEIARNACIHAGVPMITTLDGGGIAATVRAVFGSKRDALLRRTLWNFAKGEETLGSGSPAPSSGQTTFANVFPLPGDCLRVWSVKTLEASEWEVVAAAPAAPAATVSLLACDLTAPQIIYIKRVDNPTTWAADFRECFEYYLAESIASAHSRDRGAISRCQQGWMARLPQAEKADAREKARGRQPRGSRFLAARWPGMVRP